MLRIAYEALTFDDVLLLPAYSEVLPKNTNLQTRLTKEIRLNIPVISAAMDTVTEAKMAISMAQLGGMGILHKNMSIERQASRVRHVKKFESGTVADPITVTPDVSVGELLRITSENKISGVPVVDENRQVVGIVTHRDLRFETNLDQPVKNVMTPKEKLVTVKEGESTENIKRLLHEHRIEKVVVIDDDFRLKGLITVNDFSKAENNPNSCKDNKGRLRVGAAVGTGADTEARVEALVDAGVDVIIVDTAHGHSRGVIDRVSWIKKHYNVQVIGGNIATGEAALMLADAGADAVKVGIGPGSICTTRIIAGIGVPQVSAIDNVASALNERIPLIADGGIRFSGDMAKALAAGASSIMVGSLLAGTEEAPGDMELYQGRYYKAYRGMGSLGAMSGQNGSSDRYFQDAKEGVEKLVPEGIEGRVPYKGSVNGIINQLVGGLRSSMGYTGCATIEELRTKPQFIKVTSAGMKESHVHDVQITKEAPNYRQN